MKKIFDKRWMLLFILILISAQTHAAIDATGILDNVYKRYSDVAGNWGKTISAAAQWLFVLLASISMVWTFGILLLRKADLGEFFTEIIRFFITLGFFEWLLWNGTPMAVDIFNSFIALGGKATGVAGLETPSDMVDIGFNIVYTIIHNASVASLFDSIVGILLGLMILGFIVVMVVNLLILKISAQMLAYAGIFILGFGASRWTSDMAIAFYKTVLNIGLQLMAMILLMGTGKQFITDYFVNMSPGTEINLTEMVTLFIAVLILYLLSNRIPSLLGHLAMGGGTHAMGQGYGAVSAAAAMSMTGAMVGGAMGYAGANLMGAGMAVHAASDKASNDFNAISPLSNSQGGRIGQNQIAQMLGGGSMGKAGAIAAGTVSNLAERAAKVALSSAISKGDGTFGGKVADAIKNPNSKSTSDITGALSASQASETSKLSGVNLGNDTLAGVPPADHSNDYQAEIEEFVNRG